MTVIRNYCSIELFGLKTSFQYDANGDPTGFEISISGTVRGKYYVVNGTNKKEVISMPNYPMSQYGITKLTYYTHPNTNLIDSVYETTNDTFVDRIVLVQRNSLDEIIEINAYLPWTTSNLSHVRYYNIVYQNENITSYQTIDAYNHVFSLTFNYDLNKLQKPYTNSYLYLYDLHLFNPSGLYCVNEYLGLSFGKTSKNAIISGSEVPVDFGYQTYNNAEVQTNTMRQAGVFGPDNLYYRKNTYY